MLRKSKVFDIIDDERKRQDSTIELIASENYVSENVLKAVGSCMINKYAEGYPGNRYYGGCENVDELESYCKDKWLEVFGEVAQRDYDVNVQPHSGSQANFAALSAVLNIGDTILSIGLDKYGHLTHGSRVNFSGNMYNIVNYGITSDGHIDYNDIRNKIAEYRPKLVLIGYSSYPREIDFARIYTIISSVYAGINLDLSGPEYEKPLFMVDMAHIAGLVAAGFHKSPFGWADIITTTTHKTLRGARGGLIFSRLELSKKIDKAVFPYSQGGPLMNMIAGKAVAAEEACEEEFKEYIRDVVDNCKAMAYELKKNGFDLVTGGTDNHLILIDLTETHPHISGLDAQEALEKQGITVNKNCVPNDRRSPKLASGIRLGTAAMTTKGLREDDFRSIAKIIAHILDNLEVKYVKEEIKEKYKTT